ncbi:MAG: MarR family transcriptional regulator [Pseudomonadota bacterium]
MPDRNLLTYFTFFNEVGIIEQLGRAAFEARLPDGFLVSHFSVLNHLVRLGDGKTPLELASAFQVPKTTMTHTLARLQSADLVAFVPNPKDGRSKCVVLTDKGRNFREDAIGALAPELQAMADAIPKDRVEALLPALQEIRVYLDRARDT